MDGCQICGLSFQPTRLGVGELVMHDSVKCLLDVEIV